MSRDTVVSIAATVLVVPAGSSRCLSWSSGEEDTRFSQLPSPSIGLKDAAARRLPRQQHPGSFPPHRHVSCQSNPQQQHRIAQAPPGALARSELSENTSQGSGAVMYGSIGVSLHLLLFLVPPCPSKVLIHRAARETLIISNIINNRSALLSLNYQNVVLPSEVRDKLTSSVLSVWLKRSFSSRLCPPLFIILFLSESQMLLIV